MTTTVDSFQLKIDKWFLLAIKRKIFRGKNQTYGNERGAAVGWNSVNSNPRVPENARNCREIEGITILREHDGAPVEGQAHVA